MKRCLRPSQDNMLDVKGGHQLPVGDILDLQMPQLELLDSVRSMNTRPGSFRPQKDECIGRAHTGQCYPHG